MILVELSTSQFLQLVNAVFDEAAKQLTIVEHDEDTRTDDEKFLDCFCDLLLDANGK